MSDYITAAEIKANLPEAGMDTSYDAVLASVATAVSRSIDKIVGGWDNYFAAPNTATVRYYDGNKRNELWIDDALSISEIAIDYGAGFEVISPLDYVTAPYNSAPIQRVIMAQSFPRYARNIRVTAVFGYSSTPPSDVKQAALIQATRLFMRTKQAYMDGGASPEFGQTVINFGGSRYEDLLDKDVRILLRPYIFRNGIGSDD